MSENIRRIYKKLIVSCQALPNEPLHSSFIMGRMAKAAKEGGACGIRANTREDIEEIRKNVDLPIIGIVKKIYENSPVYITPTMKEVDDLVAAGADYCNGRNRCSAAGRYPFGSFYHAGTEPVS